MKYQQIAIGFVLGILFSFAAYKVVHHVNRAGGFAAAMSSIGQPVQADNGSKNVNELTLSKLSLAARSKLSEADFTYDVTCSNKSVDAVMQLFINVGGTWQQFTPSTTDGPIVVHLFEGADSTGTFKIDLPKGQYSAYRLILFGTLDGKSADYNHTLWDSEYEKSLPLPKLDLTIASSDSPVDAPTINFPPNPKVESAADGSATVTIPAMVKYPASYQITGGGFWAMAKGSGGFAQVWADQKASVTVGTGATAYQQIPVIFVLKNVKPGFWNLQFGLFKSSFGDALQWTFPGLDFEVGGSAWELHAPADHAPPRLMVANNRFEELSGAPYNFYPNSTGARSAAQFLRGGNYGNAISWTTQPALDNPGFFTLLAHSGCRYIRFNFNPDQYLNQRVYQDCVDQVIQNIWAAGLYPVIAPQDLPKGNTLAQRIDEGDRLMTMVATKYAGKSVWIEECNEPSEFSTWALWKPVAERYLKTIRAIDPGAFVVVPFENYSKDGNGAALSPIVDQRVDLYDGHAYIDPDKIIPAYGAALKRGLPVMIGEYGSTDAAYLHQMDLSFQSLSPAPVAISPWAFTIKGQDSLPLIEDASGSQLIYTEAGQAISDDYQNWDNGTRIK